MSSYYIILFIALIGSIQNIMDSYFINKIDILSYIFITHIVTIFIIIYMYIYTIKKEEKNKIFSFEYRNIWLYSLIISIISLIIENLYLKIKKDIGPGKTESITKSLSIIFTILLSILLSIYLYNKKKMTYNIFIGSILIILGINIIKNTQQYL